MFAWIITGLLAGFIASRIMGLGKGDILKYLVLGTIGSLVGGFAGNLIGLQAHGLIGSVITSVIGACIAIWISRTFMH